MFIKVSSLRKHERAKDWQLLSLAAPAVIFFFIFSYIPMAGIFIAFKNVNFRDGIFKSPWAGFKNFEFFFKSSDAWIYTRNTLMYNFAGIILGTITALVIAMLLNEIISRAIVKTYQTILFFPYFFSWVIAGLMMFSLFAPAGILTTFFKGVGIDITDFYNNMKYWPPFLVLVSIWKSAGYSSVIYYASIMSISGEYYEAAEIDGASRSQCARHITLPLLSPIIIMMTILAIGSIFRADFGLYYFIPRDLGQLYPATQVIDTAVYRMLRGGSDMGMTTAVGLFQSAVGFVLVLATNAGIRKIQPENSLF